MKKIIKFSLFILLFLCFTQWAVAQGSSIAKVELNLNIPPVALIDLATYRAEIISHSFSLSSTQAQQLITKSDIEQTWLNYSSIVRQGSLNYITANISSGHLPPDVLLHVSVGQAVGSGNGALGNAVGNITLTYSPKKLINDIGSCYTGKGVNNGRLLNYVWDNPKSYDYYLRYQHGTPIAVTYTITSH